MSSSVSSGRREHPDPPRLPDAYGEEGPGARPVAPQRLSSGILRPARALPTEHLAPALDWHADIAAATRPNAGLATPPNMPTPPVPADRVLNTARASGIAPTWREGTPPRPTWDVSGHAYEDTEFAALLAQVSDQVRALHLGDNALTQDSLAALAAASMPRLKTLVLCGNPLGPGSLPTLHGAMWPALQRLDLRGCALGDADVAALSHGRLRGLRELRLANNALTARSTTLLAGHAFAGLELLDLAHNPLGEDGLTALFEGAFFRLKSLDLAHTGGTAGAVRRLVHALLPELRRLDMSGTPVWAEQAKWLGRRFGGRLQALSLRSCSLTATSCATLLEPDWPVLRSLDVDDNRLGTRGLEALVEARSDGRLPRLSRLLVPAHNLRPAVRSRLLDAAWAAMDLPYRHRRRTLVQALMPVLAEEPPAASARRVRLPR